MEMERPRSSKKRQRSARRREEAETRDDGEVTETREEKEGGAAGRKTSIQDSGGSAQMQQQTSTQGEGGPASQQPAEETLFSTASPESPRATLEPSPGAEEQVDATILEEPQTGETLATAREKEEQPPSPSVDAVEITETTDPSIAKKPLADSFERSESIFPTPPIDDLLTASSDEDGAAGAGMWGEGNLSVFQHLDREEGQRSPPPPYTADFSPIHHLLVLTEGETELDSDKEIPDIFSKEEQLQYYSDINELHTGLEEEGLEPYLERFREEAEAEAVMVGKMSLHQIQAEEQRLQSEFLSYQSQEAARQGERQREVARREEGAKREVTRTIRKRRGALKKKKAALTQHSMVKQKEVYSAFNKAEQNMVAALKARKAEVKTLYGNLERADGYYGAVKGRRWKVDWSEAPQPVQIKIKTLRAVRDKLPASRYVLLVSLYDRLGGHVLRWAKMKGQQWGAATLPVEHQGHFYDIEIKFDQSVYTVLPSRPNIRPGMVLVFELFILRGPATPTDRVIGWGAFPISDADFNIIEGKYKCPFLRGSVDPATDKHSKVERLMAKDIDNWLANLYFQVIKLPRYLSGMHEYEVELQFTAGLLGYPDHTHDPWGAVDGNDPVFGGEREGMLPPTPSNANSLSSNSSSREALQTTEAWSGPSSLLPALPPSRAALTSRLSQRLHSANVSDSETFSSDDEGVSLQAASRSLLHVEREKEEFQPVQGKPGLHYKVHQFNPLTAPRGGPQTLLPQTPLLSQSHRRRTTSYQHELEQYTVSVKPPFSEKGREEHPAHERLQYVGRQFISELGLSQWRSLEFWGMMVVLLLSWWVRLYLHYIAQYGFLRALGIPVNRIDFFPHTVVLNYQSSLLFTREEVGVVILGPLFNTLLFCLLVLLSWFLQRLLGGFPDLGSRFIAAFGIMAFLDPFWVLAVDMALLRYQAPQPDMPTADITKLYWHFVALENNGVVGLFLALFLYAFTSFTTLTCFYMYFLRVHMNGRLLDVYHRLKSPEENFFVPRDMEVSNEELGFICRKAEQWRGAEGERRKVAVYDYVWEVDELTEDWQGPSRHSREVTTHISIHTLHLDGLRELYRHFLRLDDGAIVEIFGELSSVTGVKSGIKQALVQQHSHLTHPSTPRHASQHSNPPSLSPPPDDYTDYQTPAQSPPPDSSNNVEGRLSSQRRGFASVPGQSLTHRTPEHLHKVKEYHNSDEKNDFLIPTQAAQSLHDSLRRTVPPPVISGYPSAGTAAGRLGLSDVPHSSSFDPFGSTGTALDMEGYESDEDSVFADTDDRQNLLLSVPASTGARVDRKGKQRAGFSRFDSPQKKGHVKSLEK